VQDRVTIKETKMISKAVRGHIPLIDQLFQSLEQDVAKRNKLLPDQARDQLIQEMHDFWNVSDTEEEYDS